MLLRAVFAIIFLSFSSAQAIEFKLERCAKYFATGREAHSVPSLSQKYTESALGLLQRFRARELRDFDYSPSVAPVNGSAKSSKAKKQAITRRISAVLAENRGVKFYSETATKLMTIGSVYKGADEIVKHLEDRRDLLSGFNEISGQSKPLNVLMHLIGSAGSLSSLYFFVPLAFSGEPWWLGATFFIRDFLEMNLRAVANYRISSDERALLRRLKKGEWQYRSFDALLVTESLERLRSAGEVSLRDYQLFTLNIFNRDITKRLTGPYLFAVPLDYIKGYHGDSFEIVQIDEVLLWEGGEPFLVNFIRRHRKLPEYPKPATQKTPSSLELAPEKQVPL